MLVATAYLRLLLRALALDEQQIQTLLEDSASITTTYFN